MLSIGHLGYANGDKELNLHHVQMEIRTTIAAICTPSLKN